MLKQWDNWAQNYYFLKLTFATAHDYNFGAQMTEWLSRFLAQKQNFWRHVFLALILRGNFFKNKLLMFFFVFETIL